MRKMRSWIAVIFFTAPLFFSLCFTRLYSNHYFLFFSTPTADDEGYFDHLNVWFNNHIYSPQPAPGCEVVKNYRGIGAAILWAPGYLAFKAFSVPLRNFLQAEDWPNDDWLRLGAASMNYFVAIGILFLTWRILRRYTSEATSVLFSFVMLFGGLLPYYFFRRPLMSHAAEAFYFLMAVDGMESVKFQAPSTGYTVQVALALSGLLSTRLQLAPAIGLMLAILAWEWRSHPRQVVLLGNLFIIGLLPQLFINLKSFGSWMTPPSFVRPFLSPLYLMEVGSIQLIRLFRIGFGKDWGLFWMCPWLVFACCVPRTEWEKLWPVSRAWLLGPLPTLLMDANFKAHGASYGHRYVNLVLIAATILAALGYDRLHHVKRWKVAALVAMGLFSFISLTHFVAFESDDSGLTLRVGKIQEEGPSKKEWEMLDNGDWVNGSFSKNVYALALKPRLLLQKFGAAPFPLAAMVISCRITHRPLYPPVATYLTKHEISLRRYARYVFLVMFGDLLVWLTLYVLLILRARTKSLSPGLI